MHILITLYEKNKIKKKISKSRPCLEIELGLHSRSYNYACNSVGVGSIWIVGQLYKIATTTEASKTISEWTGSKIVGFVSI